MFKRAIILAILCCASVLVAAADPCDLDLFCTPSQALECVQSVKFEDSFYKETIEDIVKSIEPYVYLDILKNPPQPEGFSGYFEPVDLISKLKAVKTEGVTYFDFYKEVASILMSARDGHFMFMFLGSEFYENKLLNFMVSPPLEPYVDTDENGEPIMKGTVIDTEGLGDIYASFDKGAEIKAMIEKNADVPIVSINDMDPFEYIYNFGSEYLNYLKNKNARYTYATHLLSTTPSFYYFPLTLDDFSNFTVVYANGDTFSSDFYFMNTAAIPTTRKRSANEIVEVIREKIRNSSPYGKPVGLKDVLKALNSDEKPQGMLTEKEAIDSIRKISLKDIKISKKAAPAPAVAASGVSWDYETSDGILKCKADKTNEANVYITTSFSSNNTGEYIQVLVNCVSLFEGNSYPIIVVTDNNVGGNVVLSGFLQECVQQDMVAREYASFKSCDAIRTALKYFTDPNVGASSYSDPDTCEDFKTADEIMKDPITDNYGNGITHTRTKPVLLGYKSLRNTMDQFKPLMKNRRKPTDIVVFTDSYSFSAGSIFTKGLREAGGAIIVGYNGYPGSTAESFDIGQCPTQVLNGNPLQSLNPTEYNRLFERGITYAGMSFGETFRHEDYDSKKTSPTPRDFLVDPADARAPFYSAYSDDVYDVVVTAGKAYVEAFKTNCNPNNPKLHMRSEKCDPVINKAHMHGGYTCGADGKWSTTCEGYYCDDGYYFDTYTKECVADPCSKSFSSSISISILLMFFIVFAMF